MVSARTGPAGTAAAVVVTAAAGAGVASRCVSVVAVVVVAAVAVTASVAAAAGAATVSVTVPRGRSVAGGLRRGSTRDAHLAGIVGERGAFGAQREIGIRG